jgi:hypothetical protein
MHELDCITNIHKCFVILKVSGHVVPYRSFSYKSLIKDTEQSNGTDKTKRYDVLCDVNNTIFR